MAITREEYTDAVALGMLISACLLTDNPKYKKFRDEFHQNRDKLSGSKSNKVQP